MDVTTGVSLLVLLLGLCSSHPIIDHSADRILSSEPTEDITSTILRMNQGSRDFLFEGDMLIPRSRNSLKCLNKNNTCFWPKSANGNVEIPFSLSDTYDNTEKNVILQAMAAFEPKTCIRFIPRGTQWEYLSIEPRYGCFSMLGRIGDKQVVSLQRFGCVEHGIVQHELLHALGFYHEHTRSDRDNYVKINLENIVDGMQYNFDKKDTNNLNTPYDYSSIMHYGRTAFAKSGSETIIPIPNPSVPIGQRQGLSDIDILRINRLYNCSRYRL
ncbi:low choriolytic enzyme-like [Parambassis ranga]|uniref:Metalloendopeptidase n=1 Tax=Parambassis ranga TaxID=210632 RepID=A0A6P7HDV7_9TELE|nr:low choriolytic enzyme-like [Parambassis ranga]XP_028253706.1 low choriolytic enzyme-like [Parambassis ranga]